MTDIAKEAVLQCESVVEARQTERQSMEHNHRKMSAMKENSRTPYHWTEEMPGRWERAMDTREKMLVDFTNQPTTEEAGCPYYAITYLELDFKFSDEEMEHRLRQGWRAMRYDHPSMASRADPVSRRMIYEAPQSESTVTEWLGKTFNVDRSGRSAEQLFSVVDVKERMCFLTFLPKTREVLLGFHHLLIDGGGVILFFDNLLRSVVKPRHEICGSSDISRLSLPLQAVVRSMAPCPDAGSQARQYVEVWAEKRKAKPESICVYPTGDLNKPPSWCRQICIVLTEAETSRLLAACKMSRLTISVATHAAVIMASKQHGGNLLNDGRNWISALVFSFRHQAIEPYNTNLYPLSIMSAGLPQIIENPVDFSDAAAKLKAAYKFWQCHDNIVDLLEPIQELLTRSSKDNLQKARKVAVANTSGLGVLKDLKEQYGDRGEIQVLKFAGGMRETGNNSPHILVQAYSWCETLCG